jgi:serine/threonine protein kinase
MNQHIFFFYPGHLVQQPHPLISHPLPWAQNHGAWVQHHGGLVQHGVSHPRPGFQHHGNQHHVQQGQNPQFQPFRILSRGGGFNNGIWLANDIFNNTRCVIKLLKQRDIRTGHAQREISTLFQLRMCTHISTILDWDRTSFKQIVLQYYESGNLEDVIKRHRQAGRPIPTSFIWKVFFHLASALSFMHYHGQSHAPHDWNWIIHRDIHPANVFLSGGSRRQYPKMTLGDFGCSISNQQAQTQGHRQVSRQHLDFRTPEENTSRRKSDVYQVALVIICLCRLTFDPREHARKEFPAGSTESFTLNQILRKCLERRYDERLGATELHQTLLTMQNRMSGEEGCLLM